MPSEDDYILIANLTRVRTARAVLRDVILFDGPRDDLLRQAQTNLASVEDALVGEAARRSVTSP